MSRIAEYYRPHTLEEALALLARSGLTTVSPNGTASGSGSPINANSQQKPGVVDADLGLANVDVLLGLHPEYNLAHVLSGERTLEEVLVEAPADHETAQNESGSSRRQPDRGGCPAAWRGVASSPTRPGWARWSSDRRGRSSSPRRRAGTPATFRMMARLRGNLRRPEGPAMARRGRFRPLPGGRAPSAPARWRAPGRRDIHEP